MSGWTASDLYGMPTMMGTPNAVTAAPTQHMAPNDAPFTTTWKGLFDVRNPVFWFGVVLFVTVGAAGAAGSIKLGPAKVSGSVGKTS
jgi:hypothetical protein